jgi:putative hemolysin
MNDNGIFQINVREILQSKAPALYKKIPGFMITWLARLICQDQLNDLLRRNAGLTGVPFMENTLQTLSIDLRLQGIENLPDAGHRCIFVSNHPLGGLDGICLSAALGKKYDGNIRYLVNDILYFIKPLQTIFIPINKHGTQAKTAVALLHEAFASENQIITFPAGLCSRKTKGVIRDPQWKKMFISKAIEYKRDVVPVYFDARNSNLFYAIANIRKQLGLKFNIEMLFLPREMMKQRRAVLTVSFGKPVKWQTFDSSKTPQEWADEMENSDYNNRF